MENFVFSPMRFLNLKAGDRLFKAMLQGEIFLATCNAVLLLKNVILKRKISKLTVCENLYLPILHLSEVEFCCKYFARKILSSYNTAFSAATLINENDVIYGICTCSCKT